MNLPDRLKIQAVTKRTLAKLPTLAFFWRAKEKGEFVWATGWKSLFFAWLFTMYAGIKHKQNLARFVYTSISVT